MNATALVLPGIGNSGPDHWQTLWEMANPAFVRVPQRNWDRPDCEEWCENLEKYAGRAGANVVLIAHSLACLLVAHWVARTHCKVRAALLVAPPNPDGPDFPEAAIGFSPLPMKPFTFPSIVVASSNDPYGSLEFARCCATVWGSRFVGIGAVGHINSESGLGAWREGFAMFQQLAA
jgi:predicted alpha/beta hydrolase family esterase